MKMKLMYARDILNKDDSELAKQVFEDMLDKEREKLAITIRNYMGDVDIANLEKLKNISESALRKRIEQQDNKIWREEVRNKTTLKLYGKFKENVAQENYFDKTYESSLLFRARSDALDLGWRKVYQGQEGICKLCDGMECETLEHFVLKYKALEEIRQEFEFQNKTIYRRFYCSVVTLALRTVKCTWV